MIKRRSVIAASIVAAASALSPRASRAMPARVAGGEFVPDTGRGGTHAYVNDGAHAFAAPDRDGGVDVLVTNGPNAGVVTFAAAYRVPHDPAQLLTVRAGDQFIVSVRRIAGVATVAVFPLQGARSAE